MLTDVFPAVSQLISEPDTKDNEQRWLRTMRLFRPGLHAWLQVRRLQLAIESDHDSDGIVDNFFAEIKSEFIGQLDCSTEEFCARLTRAMGQHLQRTFGKDQPDDLDTQSMKLSGAETESVTPHDDGNSPDRLLALLPQLSESLRPVAAMRWIEGLKYHEIAERTGLQVAESVSLDRDAQSQLLKLLQNHSGGTDRLHDPDQTMDATSDKKS